MTVSYRVFGEVREVTGSLVFGGGPTEGPNGTVACKEYTINAGANVRTNRTGRTGNESQDHTNGSGNFSRVNVSNVSSGGNRTDATDGNRTAGNDSSAQ